VVEDLRAEGLGDRDGRVGGARVDDDDLVDGVARGLQAAPEHRLLVLDDHAQRQPQAGGRPRGRGDGQRARRELAHRARRLRQHARVAPAAVHARAQVAVDVRELRVEPTGAEERLGAPQRAGLEAGDARVVEQHGLARLALERVDGGPGGRDQRGGVGPGGEAGLDDRTARRVAAVGVADVGRPGPGGAIAGPVAGGGVLGVSTMRRAMARLIGGTAPILSGIVRRPLPRSGDPTDG
jgi:hypothetical protein